jgi:uncharacterized protein
VIRLAFGAIAVALPESAEELALLLIEQFQYIKLGAVLDLFDLWDTTEESSYHSPWHSAPQPLRALFEETYARVAATGFLQARRTSVIGPDRDAALVRYTTARAETRRAAQTLASSGALTPIGLRFAEGMLAAL